MHKKESVPCRNDFACGERRETDIADQGLCAQGQQVSPCNPAGVTELRWPFEVDLFQKLSETLHERMVSRGELEAPVLMRRLFLFRAAFS